MGNNIDDYFYSGIVLMPSRESNLVFDGTWPVDDKNDTFPAVLAGIKQFESNAHGGASVALTAFNKL